MRMYAYEVIRFMLKPVHLKHIGIIIISLLFNLYIVLRAFVISINLHASFFTNDNEEGKFCFILYRLIDLNLK